MQQKGFDTMPMLEIDGRSMAFSDAVKWINSVEELESIQDRGINMKVDIKLDRDFTYEFENLTHKYGSTLITNVNNKPLVGSDLTLILKLFFD